MMKLYNVIKSNCDCIGIKISNFAEKFINMKRLLNISNIFSIILRSYKCRKLNNSFAFSSLKSTFNCFFK